MSGSAGVRRIATDGSEDILKALLEAQAAPEVRLITLVAGTGAFGAGAAGEADADLFTRLAEATERVQPGPSLPAALRLCDKPTLAVLSGAPIGGAGLDLALLADVRLATSEVRLRFDQLDAGHVPSIACFFLPRMVGLGEAADLLLAAREIRGDEAHRIGLVDRLAATADLERVTAEIEAQVSAQPPITVRLAKRMLLRGATHGPADGRDFEALYELIATELSDEPRDASRA